MKNPENDTEESNTQKGHLHPLSLIIADIGKIFSEMGFDIAKGPEIETEYYNFDALNVPKDHPARDMWDTFWIKPQKDRKLLRAHTSPVQVRYMETHKPPIRIVAPGKCYRHEATDATHDAEFYQIEALMIDKDITMGNLIWITGEFFSKLLGKETKTRLRPSYFPFVEPGAEIDMTCFKCGGKGCTTCKQAGWIEIGGAGMVHPNVLLSVGINPNEYQGFAFGFGIGRLTQIKYGINDNRLFHSGDLRLTNQF